MTDPARPPPPKSYVPITLLEGPLVPDLPPRPEVGEIALPARPDPQSSPPSSSAMSRNEVVPNSAGGDSETTPSNPPPVKPERHKNKKGPPKPPQPYNQVKETPSTSDEQEQPEHRISFQFGEDQEEEENMSDAPVAGRRHTVGSKDATALASRKLSSEISRPKFSPPDVMTESLYTAVNKKNKRYPAPEVPAPPPPYERKALPKKPPPAVQEEPVNGTAERSISPPGYEPVATASVSPTNTGLARPQGAPPRFPPSRPARPPAANAPPPPQPTARNRSSTVGAYSAAAKARSKKTAKTNQHPEITIMGARPMENNALPSPYLAPLDAPKKPAPRPSPPQPKKPATSEQATDPPKPKPPATRPSPPQPQKTSEQTTEPRRPKLPSTRPLPPSTRPSPPQPRKTASLEEPAYDPPVTKPPSSRPSPPQPRKPPAESAPPPKPERGKGPPPPRPGPPPAGQRPPPPKVGAHGSPPAPRKRKGEAATTQQDRGIDPTIVNQLSALGPPPDDDLPEIPLETLPEMATEVVNEGVMELDEEEADSGEQGASLDIKVPASGAADPPSKPPQPTRQPLPPKRNKASSPSTKKKQSSPKLPAPVARPPPPKPSRRASGGEQSKPSSMPPVEKKPPLAPVSERQSSIEDSADKPSNEAPSERLQAELKKPTGPAPPKRPAPVKRPLPAARPPSLSSKEGSEERPEPSSSEELTEGQADSVKQANGPVPPKRPRPAKRPLSASLATRDPVSSGQEEKGQPSNEPVTEGPAESLPAKKPSGPAAPKRPPPIKRPSAVKVPPSPSSSDSKEEGSEPSNQLPAESQADSLQQVEEKRPKRPPPLQRPAPAVRKSLSSESSEMPVVPVPTARISQRESGDEAEPESLKAPEATELTHPESPIKTAECEGEGTSKTGEGTISKPTAVKRPPPLQRPPPPRKAVSTDNVAKEKDQVGVTVGAIASGDGAIASSDGPVASGDGVIKEEQKEETIPSPKARSPTPTHETSPPLGGAQLEPMVMTPAVKEVTSPVTSPVTTAPAADVSRRPLSIKKPPPPVTTKPKSRSPTPATSPEPPPVPSEPPISPNPPVSSKPLTPPPSTDSEPAGKPVAVAPGKRMSIKKPPPPRIAPKSRSPTPLSTAITPPPDSSPSRSQDHTAPAAAAAEASEAKKGPEGSGDPKPAATKTEEAELGTPVETEKTVAEKTEAEKTEAEKTEVEKVEVEKAELEKAGVEDSSEQSLPPEKPTEPQPKGRPAPPRPQVRKPGKPPPPPVQRPQKKAPPKESTSKSQPKEEITSAEETPPTGPSQSKASPEVNAKQHPPPTPQGSMSTKVARAPRPSPPLPNKTAPKPPQPQARTSVPRKDKPPPLSLTQAKASPVTPREGEHLEEGVHVLRYSESTARDSKPPRPGSAPRSGHTPKGSPQLPRAEPEEEEQEVPTASDSPPPNPRTIRSPLPVNPLPPVPVRPGPPPAPKPAPSRPPPSVKPSGPPKPPAPSAPQPSTKPKPPVPSLPQTSARPARPSTQPPSSVKPPRPGAPSAKPTASSRPTPRGPPTLPPRPTPGHPLYKYVCVEPHGIATCYHEAMDEDEMSFDAGDVIELIEKVDEHWYFAANADTDMCEGLVQARQLKIIKRLPGQDMVAGFEEGPCAVATHDFQGETPDELSFNAGVLIMLKTHYGKDWFRGKLVGGAEGIFPKNFVEVVEELPADAYEAPAPLPASTSEAVTSEMRGPHGVATFPFTAEGPGELTFSEGDQVELLERVDAAWMKGRLRGKEGIFPTEFVKVIVELPPQDSKASKAAGASKGQLCTARYDFDGQEGELSFKVGDRIKVVSRVSAEWVNGEFGGAKGMFPADFVDGIPDDLPEAQKEASKAKDTDKGHKAGTGKCEALFDFEGESDSELSFVTGEMITTLEKVDQDWMKGRIGTREGIFPVSFVKVITEIATASPIKSLKPSASTGRPGAKTSIQSLSDDLMPKGVAIADYSSGEISFQSGEILYLLAKEGKDKFMGERVETGDLGVFPANCIEVLVPLP